MLLLSRTAYKPDAVLLMAGTNDIGQLYNVSCDKTVTPWQCSVQNILDRLEVLVAQILKALPAVKVFLSDVVGIGPKPCYGRLYGVCACACVHVCVCACVRACAYAPDFLYFFKIIMLE